MAIDVNRATLEMGKTALLICDMQEGFSKTIYEWDKIAVNCSRMIQACKIAKIPMLAAEINVDINGHTIKELDLSAAKVFYKRQFSMYTPELSKELATLCDNKRPKSVMIIGVHTHVCVECTVLDLKKAGYEVHVIADCCSAVTQEDRMLAFERMKQIGCVIATSQNVMYQLLAGTEHTAFDGVAKVFSSPSLNTGLATTTIV